RRARRARRERHRHAGNGVGVLRSPRCGRGRRRPLPRRCEAGARRLPRGSDLAMAKVLTAARVRVPPANEADYLATLRELCQFAEARGQRIWVFRNAKDPQLFTEFSESPTE